MQFIFNIRYTQNVVLEENKNYPLYVKLIKIIKKLNYNGYLEMQQKM